MIREFPYIPWESHGNGKHRLHELMGTGMGMVHRKWEGNGNSSSEEIPVNRVNHILSAGSLNNLLFLLM